eukprot:c29046_g1_i5 orf=368-1258(-)
MALGYAHSHAVADGHSMWHFMNSWAECGRGMPISVPPLHDRTLLKIGVASKDSAARFSFGFPEAIKSTEATASQQAERKPSGLAQRVFHFTADMIKKLKGLAAEEDKGGFTSYEVLCAHFWKHITTARKLGDEATLSFAVFVNCRSRLSDPLPPRYFGNAVTMVAAFAAAGKLCSESFAASASRIREAIVKASSEGKFWDMLHWLELHDNLFTGDIMAPWMKIVPMNVASSFRFPVYDVDFGWGKPAAVRTARVTGGEGEMALFPGRSGGGSVDICLSLEADAMERLENDNAFLNF